jgi:hypothetical protein
MGTKTWYDLIIEVLMEKGIPLQRKELLVELLPKQSETLNKLGDNSLGTMIHYLCRKGKLSIFKAKGIPAFYGIPSWTFQFDPYTKQKINATENHTA